MAFGNGPRIITTGLDLLVDAADRQSYPGSGTVWTDLRSGTTGSLTGSVSYTSEFFGGLTFSNSSSAVIFPSTTANYGTGSFTVEMAFKPTFINGRHYLMSKNSGSFPNWSIYLSGSNGSGKLWSEFRPTAAISCSYSSSAVFQTGSVYQIDVRILPAFSASGLYINGQTEGGVLGNGGGTLASTASLFVGNYSLNNTQNFSGSIYAIKTYSTTEFTLPVNNYNATSTRFSKQPIPETSKKVFDLLIVAGGGSGGSNNGGGGGAGGLQYITNFPLTAGIIQVITGNNAQNSSFGSLISIRGGNGGGAGTNGLDGGSGGGGSGNFNNSTTTVGGLGTSGQGNNGGNGSGLPNWKAGGGGGAGSSGESTTTTKLGDGGSGSFIASFAAIGGSPVGWFAGGGGGGGSNVYISGSGGIGGGGTGGWGFNTAGKTGSANTGGGGGGGSDVSGTGAAGGSGIVAIRYNGTPIALGGEITQSAGYTYHVFRTVGTSSFTIF